MNSLGRVAWVLLTPQATLFGELNEQFTAHFFGPNPQEANIVRATWQYSRDTSVARAEAIAASVDAKQ